MKNIIIASILAAAVFSPLLALAGPEEDANLPEVPTVNTAGGVLRGIQKLTNWVFSIFLAIAVLMIVIGAFQYLTAGGNAEKTGSAKKMLIYAVIAVVIAVSAQSIVILAARMVGVPDVEKQFQQNP